MSHALSADPGVPSCRNLHLVFGDQLSDRLAAFSELDRERDVLLLAEVDEEQTWVPVHRQRSVLFLSAMRHFALEMQEKGWRVRYVQLDAPGNTGHFTGELERAVKQLSPERVSCTHPGEWRVLEKVRAWEELMGLEVRVHEDDHFLCALEDFEDWARDRKQLVMEHFYRRMRRRHGVLLDEHGEPEGGRWNFDRDNREPFRKAPATRPPYRPRVDEVTAEVVELIAGRYPDSPGELSAESFRWPVTRAQARRALADFVEHRLPGFGTHQDAMWTGEDFLEHSLLSPPLNLKLLDPVELVDAAVEAGRSGAAPLNSVEGFVRQVLGWREFVRGVYWHEGPGYRDRNALGATGELPELYWSGETDLACLREAVRPVLEHGWSHHVQRLMLQCNLALLAGVEPRKLGDWFYGMFVDSVDWVTTPNTIGMGLHADGAVVGTKPYAAAARYVDRMSNYCSGCRFDPGKRVGEEACPLNSLYWDFLARHRDGLAANRRMSLILKGLDRFDSDELAAIREQAAAWRQRLGVDRG